MEHRSETRPDFKVVENVTSFPGNDQWKTRRSSDFDRFVSVGFFVVNVN